VTARPVAIVAGAGGAGTATAAALAQAGFHVVVLDHRLESAQSAADEAAAEAGINGGSTEARGLDLLDVGAVTALRDELLSAHGSIDVLVHLVGGWRGSATLAVSSIDDWNELHPRVVGTLATLTAVFAEPVKAAPAGRVLMVTSTAAARPTAGNIAYASAKRAAEAWMEGVANYLTDSAGASITVAVKALLTDQMIEASPDKTWSGYTHVRDLAGAITSVCIGDAVNGSRLDLTTG
jgi:NAD(P)-dependent dehydrogenase (short-subunit alcohol dehydrogenase family)